MNINHKLKLSAHPTDALVTQTFETSKLEISLCGATLDLVPKPCDVLQVNEALMTLISFPFPVK